MIKKLTDDLSVSSQLQPHEIAKIASQGFSCVINNRPDHEETGQPLHADMLKAVRESGMQYHFLPVVGSQIGLDEIHMMQSLLNKLPKPILAYCRTGTRCTLLWAMTQCAQGENPSKVVAQAQEAGYDLTAAMPTLTLLQEQSSPETNV